MGLRPRMTSSNEASHGPGKSAKEGGRSEIRSDHWLRIGAVVITTAVFTYNAAASNNQGDYFWGFLTGAVAVVVVAANVLLIQRFKKENKKHGELARRTAITALIKQVEAIEQGVRALADAVYGERAYVISLRAALQFVADSGIWAERDVVEFRNSLAVRNAAVHQRADDKELLAEISLSDLESMLKKNEHLMDILSDHLQAKIETNYPDQN